MDCATLGAGSWLVVQVVPVSEAFGWLCNVCRLIDS